ncbi:hypothetical protein [Flavobacterium sp. FlaQc-30]|uniref:hypothetical protein n=1 Tax=Flavobacterium sp. FlaQc-30 TaxID=3374179 RepID=UPI0037574476
MKQKIQKIIILSTVMIISVTFLRCQKDEDLLSPEIKNVSLAKEWFKKYEGNGDNLDLFRNLNYEWENAEIKETKDGAQLIVVPIAEAKKDESETWEQRLYIYKLNGNEYKALLYEFYPDKDTEDIVSVESNGFNGYIVAWDLKSGFIKAARFENDVMVCAGNVEILSSKNPNSSAAKVPMESDDYEYGCAQTGCNNPTPLRPVVVQNDYKNNTIYYNPRGSDITGGDSADYTSGYAGGGSGSNAGNSLTAFTILASGPKIDPKKENKCFNLSKSAELTIYVQQGKEGTRELIGPNEVGHVFIGIRQDGIERYYGFYPESGANSALVGVGKNYVSELRDNSKEMYHVSISKLISSSQLSLIVNYANNPPGTYNVNSYACTDFGIVIGRLGGINLPSTKVSAITFSGTSPGNLGEDIKSGNFPNTTKTIIKSTAPARKGDCK